MDVGAWREGNRNSYRRLYLLFEINVYQTEGMTWRPLNLTLLHTNLEVMSSNPGIGQKNLAQKLITRVK